MPAYGLFSGGKGDGLGCTAGGNESAQPGRLRHSGAPRKGLTLQALFEDAGHEVKGGLLAGP